MEIPTLNFVRNHHDLSTNSGFQFEFHCDRCGNGHRSPFDAFMLGGISDVLETASNMFGGLFSGAASLGQSARSATWEKAHDTAFQKAIQEMRPNFKQCSRCGHWLDKICWNQSRGMCKDCTPDLDEEYSNIQTQAAMEQATEQARNASYVNAEKFNQTLSITRCASCDAALTGGKFCGECGTPVQKSQDCKACGADTAGGKFCLECGQKQ